MDIFMKINKKIQKFGHRHFKYLGKENPYVSEMHDSLILHKMS